MWVTVALVVAVLVILFFRANARPPGLPPGPFALPLVGNALSVLFLTPKVAFRQFVKDHGGILTYKIFGQWAVLVSDPALMRAGLADPAASGRIDLLLFGTRDEIIKGGKSAHLGIISTSGDVWKNQRRFTLRTLKDLGFGRNALEPIMQEELDELLQLLRRRQGEKVDVGLLFNRTIVNVLWAITIGKRYSYDDTKLEELVGKVNKMLQTFNPFHPALRFAWVKKIFPNLSIIKTTEGYMADLLTFIEGEMEEYRRQMAGKVDTGSYIGAYLHELDTLKPEEGDDSALSLDHLKANITELFLAGSETTSSTLWWAVYLLATNPGAQRAMQDEMDRVVGRDNMPTLAHMDKLPYTMATIYEVQRVGDLVPFAIPHQTTEDVTMAGYRIPRGTAMMFNLSHGLLDSKYWQEPDKFRPEHFLTDDGKLFKPDHFMPFGSGKRVCLGESLARLEVFLFLASIMHRFSWRLSEDPVVWERSTVLSRPPNFSVYAVSREEQTAEEKQQQEGQGEEEKEEEEKEE
ncbi:cytochrome P450 2J2-like isoform X6 [Eriocheir sinensis]|uniref:cytochrome P450 2J2-like isoform X6 n=1 Tax=Eriocheir sinensis TaxID=95602 RepID=UPI0021C624A2|nr:cytochrome P450 2J2-like isoform X6 [Eriocheir sinensis]XP_050700528.1 cytochrome P450 2J2-like isoform X6 [Eriocheir sinensis]XP_050700529.1 cytochrome P450 2J2-like isoform X6 [Eriocheir sinensis]XP_050700530.1 cytochrome P450 2J2-like isoform X6 [Eriocheir sinensis]